MIQTASKSIDQLSASELDNKLRKACKKIAPLWPLERFSAVNPYLGMAHQPFQDAAINLAKTAAIKSTLPLTFYWEKFEAGEITQDDILIAANKMELNKQTVNRDTLLEDIAKSLQENVSDSGLSSFAEIASRVQEEDWARFMTDRISAFAAAHYDTNQAQWKNSITADTLFKAWKAETIVDRTADIMGLKTFRKVVAKYPDDIALAGKLALTELAIPVEALDHYLFKLLTKHTGWAAHAARLDWEHQLNGAQANELIQFLTICLVWEASLIKCLMDEEIKSAWSKNCQELQSAAKRSNIPKGLLYGLIMQEAFDLSAQRQLIQQFATPQAHLVKTKATAQAIFCIDVRSEIFRRKLEQQDATIETLGFAGFFGFPIDYRPIGAIESQPHCPVLLKPGFTIKQSFQDEARDQEAANEKLIVKDIKSAWKTFKSGAVSCFSFVSPLGLYYLPKLLSDTFGLTKPAGELKKSKQVGDDFYESNVSLESIETDKVQYGIELSQQIELAKNALTAMSLTSDFADLVLIIGHGANMQNNPHAAAYDCGACGGHAGDANAKVAAAVLNETAVRAGLKAEGIYIPEGTHFLAGLHDTTTDTITLFQEALIPAQLKTALQSLKNSLSDAGEATRKERFDRFKQSSFADIQKEITNRSRDWSQLRPEWGLAGCATFIVAPRAHSQNHDLGGKSFLHTYNWKQDQAFKVLESIMTAPMVVTNWINLQYYGSTVDNKQFGAGNKTLHNITSGIGVIEGNSGDLRVGLPEQAIHDGTKYQHEPLRLKVVIEAPTEAINQILNKHVNIKQLCDNEWLFLFAMNDQGQISQQYTGDLNWKNTL